VKQVFRSAIRDVRSGKRIDAYTILILSAAVAVLSVFGVTSTTVSLAVLLAGLAVLASYSLGISRTLEEASPGRNESISWLSDRYYAELISASSRVKMLTIANYLFLEANNDAFHALMERGGEIRELMVDPDNECAQKIFYARSVGSSTRPGHLDSHYSLTVSKLQEFFEASRRNRVMVRKTTYPPPYVMNIIEFDSRPSLAFIVPSGFQQAIENRPTFCLHEYDDARAFAYFTEYFDKLWNWNGTTEVTLI
jgi:hypothetical protein